MPARAAGGPAVRPCGEQPAVLRRAACDPARAPNATWEPARSCPAGGRGPAGGSGLLAGAQVSVGQGHSSASVRGGMSVIQLSAGRAVPGAGSSRGVITLRAAGAQAHPPNRSAHYDPSTPFSNMPLPL